MQLQDAMAIALKNDFWTSKVNINFLGLAASLKFPNGFREVIVIGIKVWKANISLKTLKNAWKQLSINIILINQN